MVAGFLPLGTCILYTIVNNMSRVFTKKLYTNMNNVYSKSLCILSIDVYNVLCYNKSMGEQPECGSRPGHSGRGVDMSPVSKAQQKAVHKYVKENYDRLNISVPKGRKAELQEHAQQHGESLNGFVNRAIDHEMERDREEGRA